MDSNEKNSLGIYVHIPFCKSKCPYCAFNSIPAADIPEDGYIESVIKEFNLLIRNENLFDKKVTSIYLGGGTPSIFTEKAINRLMYLLYKELPILDDIEVTIECNPDTLNKEKLAGFRRAGINRISIGAQSFNEKELKTLGRTHTVKKTLEVFSEGRDAGFKNISIDLIFGIPNQTLKDWEKSIIEAIKLRPEHISIYGLTIEEETPYHNDYENGRLNLPPEETTVAMYKEGIRALKDAGYIHYEISNLSLKGFKSRHNLRYWSGGDYIGLGAGAHSYLTAPSWGRRRWNVHNPYHYMELMDEEGTAIEGTEEITKDEAITEHLMLGLRTTDGIDDVEFKLRFGKSAKNLLQWDKLAELGLIESRENKITLTEKGIIFSNEVF